MITVFFSHLSIVYFSQLAQLISCTGKWARNNCGTKAAQFTQTMLESGLTFVRAHIQCQNQTGRFKADLIRYKIE